MSDNEQEDQGQMSELAKVLSRYKSTKGDADKRKETSKLDMAKARAVKLEKLKQEKQVKQVKQQDSYEYEDTDDTDDEDSDSDDSEEEELVLRPKKKTPKQYAVKQQEGTGTGGRMDMLEKAILMLAERTTKKAKNTKPKKKAVRKTTVIQVNPAPQQAPVPKGPAAAPTKQVELMMNDLLRF